MKKRIATRTENIGGAIVKRGQEFYISEIKGSGYGTLADPACRVQREKSRTTTIATANLSFIEQFSVDAERAGAVCQDARGANDLAYWRNHDGWMVPVCKISEVGA